MKELCVPAGRILLQSRVQVFGKLRTWGSDLHEYNLKEFHIQIGKGYEETFSVPTLEVVVEDTAEWRFVSGEGAEEETEGERTPEEIAEEIMKTVEIERLELPSQNTQRSR